MKNPLHNLLLWVFLSIVLVFGQATLFNALINMTNDIGVLLALMSVFLFIGLGIGCFNKLKKYAKKI